MDPRYIYALHVFLIAPLLLFVGMKRDETPAWIFGLFGVMAAIIFLYHGAKAYSKFAAGASGAWINYIHILLVAPLLAYIAVWKEGTPRRFFEMLMMIAFAALGYHGFYLVTEVWFP